MSNLKFTLCVNENDLNLGYSCLARVFDVQSLFAVHKAIQCGVFGHYSKRRFFLVPLSEVLRASEKREYESELPYCDLDTGIQVYPKGGRAINPVLLGLFDVATLTY